MIFLVIIAGLVLILSAFYLVNSWQQYGTWLWPTIMVVVSLGLTIYGVWNLPVWSGNDTAQKAASQSISQTTSQTTSSSASSFSQPNNNGLTGQTAEQSAVTAQQNVLTQLKKNYKTLGSVTFDTKTKTYEIVPTDTDTVKALKYVISTPAKADDAGWGVVLRVLKRPLSSLKQHWAVDTLLA